MDFKNRTFLASLAATVGVVIVAGLGLVALGAQQGPPPGRGPGGMGGPGGQGMHGLGMMGGPGGRGPMAGMAMRGLAQLDLTDAQKAQVKEVLASNKEAAQAIAKRMIAAREALNDAVTADTFSEDSIRKAAGAVAAVEADAAVVRAQTHAKVFAVLTPEQQAKAKELRAKGKARFERMAGRGFGRGMGRGGRGPGGPGGIAGWF